MQVDSRFETQKAPVARNGSSTNVDTTGCHVQPGTRARFLKSSMTSLDPDVDLIITTKLSERLDYKLYLGGSYSVPVSILCIHGLDQFAAPCP